MYIRNQKVSTYKSELKTQINGVLDHSAINNGFEKIKCVTEDHITPFKTVQNFVFCSFKYT